MSNAERRRKAVELGLRTLRDIDVAEHKAALRQLLLEFCEPQGVVVWEDGTPVDYEQDEIGDILWACLEWIEKELDASLKKCGYSCAEIDKFRNEHRDLATSVRDEDLELLELARIDMSKAHAMVRNSIDLVLIDIFPLLNTIRYLSERGDYQNVARYFRFLAKHQRVFNQANEQRRKARERKGTQSPLTVAIEEMFKSMSDLGSNEAWRHIEDDAREASTLMNGLRERNKINVYFTDIGVADVTYAVGARNESKKRIDRRTLENKFSSARQLIQSIS